MSGTRLITIDPNGQIERRGKIEPSGPSGPSAMGWDLGHSPTFPHAEREIGLALLALGRTGWTRLSGVRVREVELPRGLSFEAADAALMSGWAETAYERNLCVVEGWAGHRLVEAKGDRE